MPAYQTETRNGPQMAELEQVGTEECPVSILHRHPEAEAWVQDILAALWVQKSTGAFPGGLDSGNWPARWFDLVELAAIEDRKVDNARDKVRDQAR